jgi:hypothetical protein
MQLILEEENKQNLVLESNHKGLYSSLVLYNLMQKHKKENNWHYGTVPFLTLVEDMNDLHAHAYIHMQFKSISYICVYVCKCVVPSSLEMLTRVLSKQWFNNV